MKSSNDFEADIPSHSESESQTQHLTNPAEQTSGVIYLLENLYQKHCGNSKIPMRRKLMWTCSALLFVYYMIGLAYYSTTMEWGFTNTIYFITVSLSVTIQTSLSCHETHKFTYSQSISGNRLRRVCSRNRQRQSIYSLLRYVWGCLVLLHNQQYYKRLLHNESK